MTAAAALFGPDTGRIARLDAQWRAQLARSLDYLADLLDARGEDCRAALDSVGAELREGPVSPWVTCLYSALVARLALPDRPPVADLVENLKEAANRPTSIERPISFDDASAPASWWAQFRVLIDTDRARVFRPVAPVESDAAACLEDLSRAREILARADSEFAAEVAPLARLVVLGAPGGLERSQAFGACSTFFMRETVLVNAATRRSAIGAADMLVHETSHILLFSLAMDQSLTTDTGDARFASAARSDPRPIDGVFHACFVSTRVHLAMSRMIASGRLSAREAEDAAGERERNRGVAAQTLDTLRRHASPTPVGRDILDALVRYWDEAETAADAA